MATFDPNFQSDIQVTHNTHTHTHNLPQSQHFLSPSHLTLWSSETHLGKVQVDDRTFDAEQM